MATVSITTLDEVLQYLGNRCRNALDLARIFISLVFESCIVLCSSWFQLTGTLLRMDLLLFFLQCSHEQYHVTTVPCCDRGKRARAAEVKDYKEKLPRCMCQQVESVSGENGTMKSFKFLSEVHHFFL